MNYLPKKVFYEGIKDIYQIELCPWDDYFARMAQTDFFSKRHTLQGTKTFFVRKNPFNGYNTVMGGLTAFLYLLENYNFSEEVGKALIDLGYKKEFVDYLVNEHKRIKINVDAISEGKLYFPNEPAIIMEGSLLDLRFAEGLLCKIINYASLSYTKWSRIVQAASPQSTSEFARRRAQNDILTTTYAMLAGINSTSNAQIRSHLDVKVVGTMGHEWIQSIGNEFDAFDLWLEHNPDRPVLLGDTIDILKSGLPNAIQAFKKYREKIEEVGSAPGLRIDLASNNKVVYIIYECVRTFIEEGFPNIVIYLTGDLDEHRIHQIKNELFQLETKYKISLINRIVWACGTKPGTCSDQSSLGGVAKLTTIEKNGIIYESIKLSKDDPIKTSIPGNNRSAWIKGNKIQIEEQELKKGFRIKKKTKKKNDKEKEEEKRNEFEFYLIYANDEQIEDITIGYLPTLVAPITINLDLKNGSYVKRQERVFTGSIDLPTKEYSPETDETKDLEYAQYQWKKDTIEDIQNRHKKELSLFTTSTLNFPVYTKMECILSEKVFNLWVKMINEEKLINIDEEYIVEEDPEEIDRESEK